MEMHVGFSATITGRRRELNPIARMLLDENLRFSLKPSMIMDQGCNYESEDLVVSFAKLEDVELFLRKIKDYQTNVQVA